MKVNVYRGLFIAITLIALLLGAQLRHSTERLATMARQHTTLTHRQARLSNEVEHYRTLAGESAASVEALRLHTAELERLRSADAATIESLRLRLRRVESLTTAAIEGEYSVSTPIERDTSATLAEGMAQPTATHHFEWSDGWATVWGEIRGDSLHCEIVTVDTLRQIVHRVPHRFLFFRFGTRALRQEIISSNPHNRIVYAEYIEVER